MAAAANPGPAPVSTVTDIGRPAQPFRDALEVRAMRLLGTAFQRSSWDACRYAGSWLGLLFFRVARHRSEIAEANVHLAFPHLTHTAARQMARRSAQNFAMMLCEFLHLRAASESEVRDYTQWQGREHLEESLEANRGVMLLTAHFGNWELMGVRVAYELPLTVVIRPTSNRDLQALIESTRTRHGMKLISKFDHARMSLAILKRNELLGVFADQYGGPEGLALPLFGHPTRFVQASTRLAMVARCPVVPVFGIRQKPWLANGRVLIKASPAFSLDRSKDGQREAAVLEGTRRFAAEIEAIVTRHPEQWLWLHRRWRPEDAVGGVAPAAS